MRELIERLNKGRMPLLFFINEARKIREECGPVPLKEELGKAVVASLDNHTEGRDLMAILLQTEGFDVITADRSAKATDIIALCRDPDVSVLCYSVEMLSFCPYICKLANMLKEEGIRDRIVYNAGGAPVNESMAEEAGCDVFSRNGGESAEMIAAKVREKRSLL